MKENDETISSALKQELPDLARIHYFHRSLLVPAGRDCPDRWPKNFGPRCRASNALTTATDQCQSMLTKHSRKQHARIVPNSQNHMKMITKMMASAHSTEGDSAKHRIDRHLFAALKI